jgi:hypothetical protein
MKKTGRESHVKALVSWEDAQGATHRFQIAYDPDNAEARYFLEGLELHVRFRLETFDADSGSAPALDGPEQ